MNAFLPDGAPWLAWLIRAADGRRVQEKIDLSKVRFLVVEENRVMGEAITDILSALGATQVVRGYDVDQAIRILRSGSVDVVFTEWVLRGRSGIELLEYIRRDPRSPNRMMPIIMVTANSEEEYVKQARDLGITEFMAKPFTVDTFYRRLVTVIARPRAFISVDSYFGPDRRRRQVEFHGPDRRQPQ
jgi:DNA-binding response OmpR family regulator